MRLDMPGAIESSLDAIPLGNGLSGGLLWGKGGTVNLSLDRGDLWDLRPHPSYTNPDFTYQTVVEMAQGKRTAELNKQYAKANLFPTKVPGARLVVELPAGVSVDGFSLDMRRAMGTAELKGVSAIDCFFSDTAPVAMVKIPGARPSFKLVGNPCFKKGLGQKDAEVNTTADTSSLVQQVGGDFSFAIPVAFTATRPSLPLSRSKAISPPVRRCMKCSCKVGAANCGFSRRFPGNGKMPPLKVCGPRAASSSPRAGWLVRPRPSPSRRPWIKACSS